jgi:hypothetical protein
MKRSAVKNITGKRQYLLVEPIAKTPYPPLGLMKISSMLKGTDPGCEIITQVGPVTSEGLKYPEKIFITSLFTWDIDAVIKETNSLKDKYPDAEISIGGIAASLLPEVVEEATGISPHIGLLDDAEYWPPDYSLNFARKNKSSISFTTRGCVRKCKFCTVSKLEPQFFVKNDWEKDVSESLPSITFWDNNWLASPNFDKDVDKLAVLNKRIDFNQGLDARLYTRKKAERLSEIIIDPIRFAFDDMSTEGEVVSAIRLAKEFSSKEISVYVLYNFKDSPEEFYYKINLLNKEGVLTFPMCYREPNNQKKVFPNAFWNTYLLRALKLSLMFYYRKGMITESRKSFINIYGESPRQFIDKLYDIYEYDKKIKRK